tara:strand:- start:486 stop:743 length:258 start_codon:yes stop_codon:yes gene_type:complete
MTEYTKSVKTEKEKNDECFKEMRAEFDLETQRLIQETQKFKEKEEEEFIRLVYESGIPICSNNKLTILDKSTNKIVELSGNRLPK